MAAEATQSDTAAREVDETTDADQDVAPVETDAPSSVPARTHLKFAMHVALLYVGRAAEKIVSLYSKTFKLDPEYVADFNKSAGMEHARHGRWEKAVPLLEKALAVTPDDQGLRMQVAKAYDASGHPEGAREHLERIIEADPDAVAAIRAMGVLCSRQDNYDQAIVLLEKATKLAPDHAGTFYRLGAAYDNKEQYDKAIRAFKKAIALDPRYANAYQALGFAYESKGDRESAVKHFKKALELE